MDTNFFSVKRLVLIGVALFCFAYTTSGKHVYSWQRIHLQQLNVETCAEAGYTNGCCVPGNTNCFVSGGTCFCDITCHDFGDCCSDINEIGCSVSTTMPPMVTMTTTTTRPPRPPVGGTGTCANAGYTNGCCDNGSCFVPSGMCYCHANCHREQNCCPDIEEIGCVPTTCTEASLEAGCCSWFNDHTCHVPGGQCYCDTTCHLCGDCCTDVGPKTKCSNGMWMSKLQQVVGRKKRVASSPKE